MNFSGSTLGNINANVVYAQASNVTTDNVPKYANGSGVLLADSGYKMSDKLNVDGTLPLTGALDCSGNDVKNSGNVRPRDDNFFDIGSSTKRYKTLFYGTLNPDPRQGVLLADGTVPMTSNLNLASNSVNNVSAIRKGTTDTLIGPGTSSGSYNLCCNTNTNGTVNSIIIGDSSCVNVRPNSALCDLGSTGAPFNNINAVGNLRGLTYNRAVDDVLSNSGSAGAIGNLPTYSSTNGRVLTDSGVLLSSLVVGPASSVVGDLPTFSSTTGKVIADSGVLLSSLATTSSVAATYLPKAGGTMTGGIVMGTNTITGTGSNSALSYAASGTTDSSSTSTGTITSAGGIGVSKKAIIGDYISAGTVQTIAYPACLNSMGACTSATGMGMACYVAADQYPAITLSSFAHDQLTLAFDAGYNGGTAKSSSAASNFGIYKNLNRLNFNYASGVTVNTNITWNTAGYVDTSGILQWQKAIKSADTTASSSTSTGSIVTAGGLGVAGNAYLGQAFISGTGNLAIGGSSAGSASGVLVLSNAAQTPLGVPNAGGILYVTGGALRYRGSAGTDTLIAAA